MADDENSFGALWGAIKKADPTGALQKGEDLATGGQTEAERLAAAARAQAEAAAAKARQTGASVISAITGEEPARKLTADEVKEVQSALGLGQGPVGPKTRTKVTEFAKENGLDPASIITPDGKGLMGTPEFLGAIEAKTGIDLDCYKPTEAVSERVAKTLGDYAAQARDGVVNTGKEALGWIEQKTRDLCAATGNVNPDGSCKTPEATPGSRTGGMERQN